MIDEELIAPCGMNCAICSKYLSFRNHLKKSKCIGCRLRKEECSYLFGKCDGKNHGFKEGFCFCFECEQYPCKELKRVDTRYKKNYRMSVIENLEYIQKKGIQKFVESQFEKYSCGKCGELISIHNRRCFKCEKITKLVEKY